MWQKTSSIPSRACSALGACKMLANLVASFRSSLLTTKTKINHALMIFNITCFPASMKSSQLVWLLWLCIWQWVYRLRNLYEVILICDISLSGLTWGVGSIIISKFQLSSLICSSFLTPRPPLHFFVRIFYLSKNPLNAI